MPGEVAINISEDFYVDDQACSSAPQQIVAHLKRRTGDISATQNPFESGMVGTLRKTVAVLNERNVPYWIDCGTLLGLVRDQEIIPWDEDVELGAWLTDKPLFEACLSHFQEQGLVITVDKPDKLGLALPDGLPYRFRILFFDLRAGNAVRGGLVGASFPGRLIKFTTNLLDDALRAPSPEKLGSKMRATLVRCTRVLPRSLIVLGRALLRKLPVRIRNRWEIPERFFRDTRSVNFYGFEVLIPSRAEDYLAFRYGEDWVNPTRYWVDRIDVAGMRHK